VILPNLACTGEIKTLIFLKSLKNKENVIAPRIAMLVDVMQKYALPLLE